MRIYRVDVQIAGTAYIKADSEAEAQVKAKSLTHASLMVQDAVNEGAGDIPISGRRFGDPRLPEISLSPAMTCHGIWPDTELEVAD